MPKSPSTAKYLEPLPPHSDIDIMGVACGPRVPCALQEKDQARPPRHGKAGQGCLKWNATASTWMGRTTCERKLQEKPFATYQLTHRFFLQQQLLIVRLSAVCIPRPGLGSGTITLWATKQGIGM